ncbi:MAG: aldehyde ferredoxin oxidoreductase family protein [Promethearchaeota archaeon]
MTNYYGYNGKLAYINLSASKVIIKDLNLNDAKNYIGGCGLSAKIIFDLLKKEDYKILIENPLNEINPIVFASGPITATARPSSGRYSVSAISPLTGIWGESTSGGQFPAALKKSGFDAIIITGKAETPVYILVNNGDIDIKPAEKFWGLDTYKTQEKIKKAINDKRVKVACIGKAGENVVRYACIINDEGRAAGRTGMGAVLGSKKCKGIAVIGTEKIKIYEKEKFLKFVNEAKRFVRRTFSSSFFEQYGTLCYMDVGQVFGDTPSYYFTKTEFLSSHITGKSLKEEFPVINSYCFGCSIGCGRITFLEIDGKEQKINGPEYETTAAYGPLLGIPDMKSILIMNKLSNEQGIDTISAGVSIAFLIYLVENNIAKENIKKHLIDISIEDIKWNNPEIVKKILYKIIRKEGIGALLAEGTRKMAQELDVDPGLAAHVKGLEIPMHDPRAYFAQALSYMTSSTGANHNKCDYFNIDGDAVSFPTLRLKRKDRFEMKRKEKLIALFQDVRAVDDSAINCNFANIQFPLTIQIFNTITGFNYNKNSLLLCGERINNLKRIINCYLGIKRKDDCLPKIVSLPLESGSTKGIKLKLEKNLENYYKIREWDWETGFPSKNKLEKLGIKI